jgi:3-oxoacyl-(acyl-carrier-protein) synthase
MPWGKMSPKRLAAMQAGRCGIGELKFRDVDRLAIKIGGQVHDFDPETVFNRQQLALYDRFTQFTLLAAKEAIDQSGLVFSGDLAATRALCWAPQAVGSAHGMKIIGPFMKRARTASTPLLCRN